MQNHILTLLLVLLLPLISQNIHANESLVLSPNQAHSEIYEQVTDHVKQKADQKVFEPQIQIRKLSVSLKLARCITPLELKDRNPNKSVGRMTIGVICSQPKWQIYIPVTVDGKLPAIISTKGILKLAVIKPEDVKKVLLPYKKRPRGSAENIDTVVGMRATRAIPPNKVIKIRELLAPYWVFKNQEVTLISRIGSIEVKAKGVALENGVEQEQVSVRNLSSQKEIKGIVIAPNTILIP